MPEGAPTTASKAVDYRNLIWLCGGWFKTGKSCFTYNPRADSWAPAANLTFYRDHFGLVVLRDSLYAIGGAVSPLTAERYHPSTKAWQMLPGQLAHKAYQAVIVPIGE